MRRRQSRPPLFRSAPSSQSVAVVRAVLAMESCYSVCHEAAALQPAVPPARVHTIHSRKRTKAAAVVTNSAFKEQGQAWDAADRSARRLLPFCCPNPSSATR